MSSTMTHPVLYSNVISTYIVSTQKDMIDLSQLSPSPTRNGYVQPLLNGIDIRAHITTHRVFSYL